jgi:ubiquinone/menaquinone biosynthesis C-methylase UbiE
MWDYYGLRPWIMKYTPRHGKVIEAGCGLGRYVFYLNRLGVNIDGLDFENEILENLNTWKKEKGFEEVNFIEGDVTKLPYKDNFLSGYISLGVVEHFIDGPHAPLKEAYRVLRPGGIAIITTPSVSWYIFYRDILKRGLKNLIKKVIGKKIVKSEFFQYWYRPKKLKTFVKASGLFISRAVGADLLYSFIEAKNFKIERWTERSIPIRIANRYEGTILAALGAQSICIAIKLADEMHCFLCGELRAKKSSLLKFDVPLCDNCYKSELSVFYRKGARVSYHLPYKVSPPLKAQTRETCQICHQPYLSDILFEDFGLNKKVCRKCLQLAGISLELSNKNIEAVLRRRKKNLF